jgi:hypothetical protein
LNNILYATLAMADNPMEPIAIRNPDDPSVLLSLKNDDKLNIKGLGLLRVIKVVRTPYDDYFTNSLQVIHMTVVCAWERDELIGVI